MEKQALILVDVQRGFMPAEEGARLEKEGFGELPVPNGEQVVPKLNDITMEFWRRDLPVLTTQDWHPEQTAHFSEEPNFVDTWPAHCRAKTPGAALHPELLAGQYPQHSEPFRKGSEPAATPAEDTSYTGALARSPRYGEHYGELLPDSLRRRGITAVIVGGLAIGDGFEHPLCVDSTAIDLKRQGFDVTVLTDATEAVLPENRVTCFKNLGGIGIKLATTAEAIAELEKAYEEQ